MGLPGTDSGAATDGFVRRHRALALGVLACLWPLCWAAPAQSSEPAASAASPPLAPGVRDEARLRFDRGLALYNAGDLIGAQVEFERAYQLTKHPVVLYNLALVHAARGEAAAAVAALESLRTTGMSELGAERAARAEQVFQEQMRRVGELEVRVNVERAVIQLDNVDVAVAPAQPFRVTEGMHLLSVLAPGHEPRRLRVSVPGNAREVVTVQLVPLEAPWARLKLTTNVPDVIVRAGGEAVGRTPFAASLAFKPGTHELTFEREGYVPVTRQVTLHEGSEGAVDVALVPSDAGLNAGGTLSLALTEDNAVVSIDGEPRLDAAHGVKLPVGRHSMLVERAGFFPVEREVVVTPGPQTLEVKLLPTADYLGDYVSRTSTQRTASIILLGAGALVTLGSGGFLVWNHGEKQDAERAFDEAADEADSMGGCQTDACEETLTILVDDLDEKRQRDLYGWIGVGAGAAVLTTGVLLYALGDDPERYDPKPESDVFGGVRFNVGLSSAHVTVPF